MHIPQALSLDQNNVTLCLTKTNIKTARGLNTPTKRNTRNNVVSVARRGSLDALGLLAAKAHAADLGYSWNSTEGIDAAQRDTLGFLSERFEKHQTHTSASHEEGHLILAFPRKVDVAHD